MADRNAANVFPEPVGATTRVCSPFPIASQAPACAAVGAAKAAVNQSRSNGWNRSSEAAGAAPSPGGGPFAPLVIPPLCGWVPTAVDRRRTRGSRPPRQPQSINQVGNR